MARKDLARSRGGSIKLVSRAVRVAVAGCAVVATTPAFGLSLLDLEVKSYLGQRLIAEIPYVLAPGERLESRCLRQLRSGSSGLPHVQGLQFSIDYVRRVVRASTATTMREPLSALVLQVACPGVPQMVREYSIWLDLPSGSLAVPKTAAAPALLPQPVPAPVPVRKAASVPPPRVDAPPQSPIAAGSRYRVQIGDTLSGIAFRIKQRAPNTTWAWAKRIHSQNPEAFIGGDQNKLQAGSLLSIPSGLTAAPNATAPATVAGAGRTTTTAAPSPGSDIEASAPNAEARAAEARARAADAVELAEEQAKIKLREIEAKLSALERSMDSDTATSEAIAPNVETVGGEPEAVAALSDENRARAKLAEIERKLSALEQAVESEIGARPKAQSEVDVAGSPAAPIYADEVAAEPAPVVPEPAQAVTASDSADQAVDEGGSSAWITALAMLAFGALIVLTFIGMWRRGPRSRSLDVMDLPPETKDVRVDTPEFDSRPDEFEWRPTPQPQQHVDPADSMSVAEITLPRGEMAEQPEPEPEAAPEPAPPPVQDFGAMPISADELEQILGKEEQAKQESEEDAEPVTEDTAVLSENTDKPSEDTSSLDDTSRMTVVESVDDDTSTMAIDETMEMSSESSAEEKEDSAQTGDMPLDTELLERSYIEEFEATEEFQAEFDKMRAEDADEDLEDTRRDQAPNGKKKKRA